MLACDRDGGDRTYLDPDLAYLDNIKAVPKAPGSNYAPPIGHVGNNVFLSVFAAANAQEDVDDDDGSSVLVDIRKWIVAPDSNGGDKPFVPQSSRYSSNCGVTLQKKYFKLLMTEHGDRIHNALAKQLPVKEIAIPTGDTTIMIVVDSSHIIMRQGKGCIRLSAAQWNNVKSMLQARYARE